MISRLCCNAFIFLTHHDNFADGAAETRHECVIEHRHSTLANTAFELFGGVNDSGASSTTRGAVD